MSQKILSKKLYISLVVILSTTALFAIGGFFINSKSPERWSVMYRMNLNERAMIFLSSIDNVVTDLGVTQVRDGGLKAHIQRVIVSQTMILQNKFPNIENLDVNQRHLGFSTGKKMDFDIIMNEVLSVINENISKDLDNRLLLYYDIAKAQVSEQNRFNLDQLEKVKFIKKTDQLELDRLNEIGVTSSSQYIKLDNLVEFFIFNRIDGQTEKVTELKKILRELNVSLTLENLELLRLQYANAGVEDNIYLVKLQRLTRELSKIDIFNSSFLELTMNKKPNKILSIVAFGLAGLFISVFCIYFYLTFSIDLLRKKLAFLQNLGEEK